MLHMIMLHVSTDAEVINRDLILLMLGIDLSYICLIFLALFWQV